MKVYVISGFYIYDERNVYEVDCIKSTVHKSVEEANERVRKLYDEYIRGCEFDDINYLNEHSKDLPYSVSAFNNDTGSRVIINNEEFVL